MAWAILGLRGPRRVPRGSMRARASMGPQGAPPRVRWERGYREAGTGVPRGLRTFPGGPLWGRGCREAARFPALPAGAGSPRGRGAFRGTPRWNGGSVRPPPTLVASLIPPAHAAFLPLARGLVVNAASLGRRWFPTVCFHMGGPMGPGWAWGAPPLETSCCRIGCSMMFYSFLFYGGRRSPGCLERRLLGGLPESF